MPDHQEPWDVFFESWAEQTRHLRKVPPIAAPARERSPAFGALDTARKRAEAYARDVLRWPRLEAKLAAGHMALVLLEWIRMDGEDRSALRGRLHSAQERGRAEVVLGISAVDRMEETLSTQLHLSF